MRKTIISLTSATAVAVIFAGAVFVMKHHSKSPASIPPGVTCYAFTPKDDISAHEIAEIMRRVSGPLNMGVCQKPDMPIPDEIARNFTKVELPAEAKK